MCVQWSYQMVVSGQQQSGLVQAGHQLHLPAVLHHQTVEAGHGQPGQPCLPFHVPADQLIVAVHGPLGHPLHVPAAADHHLHHNQHQLQHVLGGDFMVCSVKSLVCKAK